jgi:hypothetical protein
MRKLGGTSRIKHMFGVTFFGIAAHGPLFFIFCDAIFVEYKMVAL